MFQVKILNKNLKCVICMYLTLVSSYKKGFLKCTNTQNWRKKGTVWDNWTFPQHFLPLWAAPIGPSSFRRLVSHLHAKKRWAQYCVKWLKNKSRPLNSSASWQASCPTQTRRQLERKSNSPEVLTEVSEKNTFSEKRGLPVVFPYNMAAGFKTSVFFFFAKSPRSGD